ncbi:hypothetical protein PV10_04670 [Exophiala mesophila]|uniref:Uncharacterized protein n=1 Tax=Exophiala mesophila TaxID=212818 RepID=A0A0D2A377_EXOME|nr:uncharacterized protein PV10_04670 [Exophiala mesophila]KIV93458.1 hypothetical protein PV10_04670 [Exophiala mesophila]
MAAVVTVTSTTTTTHTNNTNTTTKTMSPRSSPIPSPPLNPSPAITAYKVYSLGSAKLDREARRQTPDLGRLVAHANIIDNVRRWSRTVAIPTENVVVEVDPFDDSNSSDEDLEDDAEVGTVAVFDFSPDEDEDDVTTKEFVENIVLEEPKPNQVVASTAPRRRPPPPPPTTSTYDIKDHSWRQARPVMIRETAIEVDEDD